MARNVQFSNNLKNDSSYNQYLNSNWATLNIARGNLKINKTNMTKLVRGVSKGTLIASGIGIAYCGLSTIACMVNPRLSLFDAAGYAVGAIALGFLAKYSYKVNKHYKYKAQVMEEKKTKIKR